MHTSLRKGSNNYYLDGWPHLNLMNQSYVKQVYSKLDNVMAAHGFIQNYTKRFSILMMYVYHFDVVQCILFQFYKVAFQL